MKVSPYLMARLLLASTLLRIRRRRYGQRPPSPCRRRILLPCLRVHRIFPRILTRILLLHRIFPRILTLLLLLLILLLILLRQRRFRRRLLLQRQFRRRLLQRRRLRRMFLLTHIRSPWGHRRTCNFVTILHRQIHVSHGLQVCWKWMVWKVLGSSIR